MGQLIQWPLGVAGIASPTHFHPASKVESMANGSVWKVDKIPTRIAQIRAWLTTKATDGKPVIQFVHCTAGCDRTGEVIGSYRLRYPTFRGPASDVKEMYALDASECGRPPKYV